MEIEQNLFQDENLTVYSKIWTENISYFVTQQHGSNHSTSWTNDTTRGSNYVFFLEITSPFHSLEMHLGVHVCYHVQTWIDRGHLERFDEFHTSLRIRTSSAQGHKSRTHVKSPHVKATQSTLRVRVRQANKSRAQPHASRRGQGHLHCTNAIISFIRASIVGFAISFNRPSSSLRTPQRRRKSGSRFFSSALMPSFSIASREAAVSDAISKKQFTTTTTEHTKAANAEHKKRKRNEDSSVTTEVGFRRTRPLHRLALHSPTHAEIGTPSHATGESTAGYR